MTAVVACSVLICILMLVDIPNLGSLIAPTAPTAH